MMIPAFQIMTGDLIDLEHDPFANPQRAHISLESEYAQVVSVEIEKTACECGAHKRITVAIGFDGFDTVGFPQTHLLDVRGNTEQGVEP